MKPIDEFILDKVNEIEELSKEDKHDGLSKEELEKIVEEVKTTYKTQCKLFEGGSFDSPGYDINGYVIAYLDELGELQGVSIDIERY